MSDLPFVATVEVFPAYSIASDGFRDALRVALAADEATFTYGNSVFFLGRRYHGKRMARVILQDVDRPLPDAFRDDLTVQWVLVRCDPIPLNLKPKAGLFVGDDYGYPGARCVVDPEGAMNNGVPRIYAAGVFFEQVTSLFKAVMAGDLYPGTLYSARH
jgi:hypothetical protein